MTLAYVFQRRITTHPGVFLFALLMTGLAGCGDKAQTSGGGRGGGSPAPVIVAQAQRKVVPLTIEAIGAVEPMRSTSVRSLVTGILNRIAIQEGQDVKQGDLLFEIDSRPFHNALQSAEADLQKIRVQLENARAQVARYKTLSADQMVSKEQFQKIQDDARALEAQASSVESAVATARLNLDYCSIRAPLAGRTGNLGVHEGDLVRASDATAILVTINQLNPIYVTFGVPQQHLAALARYRAAGTLKIKVVPPGTDEKAEEGELTFLDNMVDSATGTLKLKGAFPNQSHRLWPGQFATVSLTLDSPEVLVVPSSAIQTSQTGRHVFVVKSDKTADLRPVIVERTYEADSVITSGLTPGETVVTDGQLRVLPGKPVEIKDTAATTGRSAAGGSEGGEGKKKKKT